MSTLMGLLLALLLRAPVVVAAPPALPMGLLDCAFDARGVYVCRADPAEED